MQSACGSSSLHNSEHTSTNTWTDLQSYIYTGSYCTHTWWHDTHWLNGFWFTTNQHYRIKQNRATSYIRIKHRVFFVCVLSLFWFYLCAYIKRESRMTTTRIRHAMIFVLIYKTVVWQKSVCGCVYSIYKPTKVQLVQSQFLPVSLYMLDSQFIFFLLLFAIISIKICSAKHNQIYELASSCPAQLWIYWTATTLKHKTQDTIHTRNALHIKHTSLFIQQTNNQTHHHRIIGIYIFTITLLPYQPPNTNQPPKPPSKLNSTQSSLKLSPSQQSIVITQNR